MARFVLCDSIPSKILLVAVFAFASVRIETPVARAQHPITGTHATASACSCSTRATHDGFSASCWH